MRRKTEKEKEENIWRRKRRKIYREGKYFFADEKKSGEGNGGKYKMRRRTKLEIEEICGNTTITVTPTIHNSNSFYLEYKPPPLTL